MQASGGGLSAEVARGPRAGQAVSVPETGTQLADAGTFLLDFSYHILFGLSSFGPHVMRMLHHRAFLPGYHAV